MARQKRKTRAGILAEGNSRKVRQNFGTILDLANEFFLDYEKTVVWFQTPNPQLGFLSPAEMVRAGRSDKLIQVVRVWLDENKRDDQS